MARVNVYGSTLYMERVVNGVKVTFTAPVRGGSLLVNGSHACEYGQLTGPTVSTSVGEESFKAEVNRWVERARVKKTISA